MRIKYIIICLMICAYGNLLYAQNQEELIDPVLPESALDLLETINQIDYSENSSFIKTNQIGENNTIDILLMQENQMYANVVTIAQFGAQNTGVISQVGHSQALGIFQDGELNQAIVNIDGNNIQSLVTQVGNGNFVEQDIENNIIETATLKIVSTEQFGDANNIMLETRTMDYGNIQVTQHGDNNNASLFTGVGSPSESYSISQTGGADVVVSQSAFYMPMMQIVK